MNKTGWPPPPLMQDDCRELSRWFASRVDAMWVLRTQVYKIVVARRAPKAVAA